ncbi:MAG TPA: DinB family protein [Thermoanaerobaculia bacterium]|nr:DinB family protein [Thermoanaerobaculia bacterium]
MAETFQEYTARIASYVGRRDPLPMLKAAPGALERRLAGVPRRALTARPAPGKWSIGEILAHLSEIELLWGYRIRTMLERDDPEIVGMDQEVWARVGRYDRRDPRASLALYAALRRTHAELLSGLSPRALRRGGRHSQFGRLTIADITRLLAGHDVNHRRQIEAVLDGRRGRAAR